MHLEAKSKLNVRNTNKVIVPEDIVIDPELRDRLTQDYIYVELPNKEDEGKTWYNIAASFGNSEFNKIFGLGKRTKTVFPFGLASSTVLLYNFLTGRVSRKHLNTMRYDPDAVFPYQKATNLTAIMVAHILTDISITKFKMDALKKMKRLPVRVFIMKTFLDNFTNKEYKKPHSCQSQFGVISNILELAHELVLTDQLNKANIKKIIDANIAPGTDLYSGIEKDYFKDIELEGAKEPKDEAQDIPTETKEVEEVVENQ